MWRRRIATLVVAAMLVALGAVAPVWAGGPSEPIYGDLNGDGVLDRARLGAVPPRHCSVLVELGRPGGGFLPPHRYTYPVPGGGVLACPDLGVAVNLGGDGGTELVVAWSAGPPWRVDFDLLVLRDFTPAGGFQAILQPSFIGLADFNGDRRLDVYEWTDRGQGFATYLNTGTGTLVPGPVRYCAGPLAYQLADFNRNGAMDVAIAYIQGCGEFLSGVVVVLDSGVVVDLQGDPTGKPSWTLNVLDANGDGLPDVVTYDQITAEIITFLSDGDGTFTASPLARPDYATVTDGQLFSIPVLTNDAASARAKISIVTPPSSGTAVVTGHRTISYRANAAHPTADRFIYRLTQDGKTSDAPVIIKIVD